MEVLAPIVLIVGGLWLVGRISRGFYSHPMQHPKGRTQSAFSHPVESELLDNSAVSDDTAQEHGAFVAGEGDDFGPPLLTDIEQTPAGINDSLNPLGTHTGGCCGSEHDTTAAPSAPAVHSPGIPPVATPIMPRPAPVRSPLRRIFSAPVRRPPAAISSPRFTTGTVRPGTGGFKSA